MSEPKPERIPDPQMIHVQEAWNVNYWCDEFNLRAEELKEIVKKVGPMVLDVRKYLARKLMASWPAFY
jgi:hypothetical protein